MHNCKATSELLVDLIYHEAGDGEQARIEGIIEQCATCLREYNDLRGLVASLDKVLGEGEPPANFWRGYESRLRQKLVASKPQPNDSVIGKGTVTRLLSQSVRIPAPIAATVLLFFAVAVYFAFQNQQKVELPGQPAIVEIRTVEKPVVQEKIVTRVIYRDRKRPTRDKKNPRALSVPGAAALAGFRPTNEVKFTVVKGERVDEK